MYVDISEEPVWFEFEQNLFEHQAIPCAQVTPQSFAGFLIFLQEPIARKSRQMPTSCHAAVPTACLHDLRCWRRCQPSLQIHFCQAQSNPCSPLALTSLAQGNEGRLPYPPAQAPPTQGWPQQLLRQYNLYYQSNSRMLERKPLRMLSNLLYKYKLFRDC